MLTRFHNDTIVDEPYEAEYSFGTFVVLVFVKHQTHLQYMCTEGIPHDTMVAILFQTCKKALTLLLQDNCVGVELFSYRNAFFCYKKFV